jgi:biofilm PGA synthesis N-glycosyltransferase PgaC
MKTHGNGGGSASLRYVLVTPARNEAEFIEKTILSVVGQTVTPTRWVIVSDGSTDGTDEIVEKHAARHAWIELVSLPGRVRRDFAGKVAAFNAGLARVNGLEFEIIGNLDADVSFDEDYFPFLLRKLAEDPSLGLVGTPYRDPLSARYDYRFASIEHVTGPCQLFRRACFDEIGGYMSVKGGAVDRIADIAARMKGWKTRSFADKVYLHHRHTGTAQQGVLPSKFKDGGKAYSVGSSPLWEFFRMIYQMTKRPFVVGSLVEASGYVWAQIQRRERPVSREMVEFCRREQMRRLRSFFALGKLRNLVTRNHFTFPFYLPRICCQVGNWPTYLYHYLLRKTDPVEYQMRNGVRLVDGTGTLAGTMAVVFVRREYGELSRFRTIVDIGAHMGSFAIYAAKSCPNARIYCYEPEEQNFNLLKQNIDINGLEGRVTAIQAAVAGTQDSRDLAVGGSLLNSFHIHPANSRRQRVNCTTLSDIIAGHRLEAIDLLKMNCEGAEYEILEQCSSADFDRIANIRLEYHNLDAPNKDGESLSRFLEARGYCIERFSRYRSGSGFIWASRTSSPVFAPVRFGLYWFGSALSAKALVESLADAPIGIC